MTSAGTGCECDIGRCLLRLGRRGSAASRHLTRRAIPRPAGAGRLKRPAAPADTIRTVDDRAPDPAGRTTTIPSRRLGPFLARSALIVALLGADVAAQAPAGAGGAGPGGPGTSAAATNAPTAAEGGASPSSGGTAPAGGGAGGSAAGAGVGSNTDTAGSGSANSSSASVNAPTTAETGGEATSTNNLARLLGIQDAPVKVYGWIQNSYTGNTNGRPRNGQNFSVFPNRLADRWQGNQYYLVLEKTLRQDDTVNFGGRFDTLFGNDWQFTKSYGLFDRAFTPNSFAGVDLPQMYAEVHLPVLTKNGLDIRGGRFYSIAGFENVQAVKRPLLSVPYLFNYTPFTLFGVLSTLHVNERLNVYGGAVNGWDRWVDANYRYSVLTGFNYNSRDLKTAITSVLLTGPDQLPRFAPADSPFLPTGVLTSAALQGRRNPNYAGNWRTYFDTTVVRTWSDKLTEAAEVFFVHETNVPALGPRGSVAPESAWYGAAHWFLYNFHPKVQGVCRAEVFRDQNGAATGSADTYYEVTLGLPYKPRPWLWIRPEARYDWAQSKHPFNDGTRSGQLTLAFDIIVQF